MDDPYAHLEDLSPEQRSSAYLTLIVNGTIMGAASHGILVTEAEIRRALRASTPEYPGTARVAALVRKLANEQGIRIPEPLFPDRGTTQEGTA